MVLAPMTGILNSRQPRFHASPPKDDELFRSRGLLLTSFYRTKRIVIIGALEYVNSTAKWY